MCIRAASLICRPRSVVFRIDVFPADAPVFAQGFGCGKEATAIPPHMDLGRLGGLVTPHRADLFHPAGMMPERAMHGAILGLQFVEPDMHPLKRLPERAMAILAMFFKTGHVGVTDVAIRLRHRTAVLWFCSR